MADTRKYIQAQKFKLAGSGINTTDTTIVLQSFQLPDGTNITTTDIGSIIYATIGPGTSKEEIISFTTVTQNADGTATLTGVTRGLKFNDPYTVGASLGRSHAGGSILILTNNPQMYADFTNKGNDETIAGLWNFTQLPTSDGGNATSGTQLITYAQALALATGTAQINRVVVAGSAGETLAAGNLVYFKIADGYWWKCDADTAATVDNIIMGIAQGAGTAGNLITNGVLIYGLDSNQTGLTTSTNYYASNTAGAISSTPGTVEVSVGISQSTTSILFSPRYNQQITEDQQDALVGTSGTPSSSNKYVTQNDTTNAATKTATTIAFVNSNPDTITDSGNGFVTAGFQEGQTITVSGSASNNGTFTIASVAAGTLTLVTGDSLVAESAGATVTITAATAGKLLRLNSTSKIPAVDGSQLTNVQATSLSKQVTSGENIAANVPAWIYNADSKAYTSHGFKSLDSTSLNLTASTSNKVAKLSDTQVMFLTDNGTTTLTINVYDINSAATVATQTVTTAFDQTYDSTPTLPSATMCRLSDTTFVVFYAHTGDNSLYFRTGTISGGTITMDTETAYPGSPNYCYGMTAVPGASDGKVVFTYFDLSIEFGTGGDSVQTLSYLTVATNSVTVTTTTTYSLSSSAYNVTPQWSNCAFSNGIAYGLFSCKDGGGIAEVAYSYINTINSVTASNQYTLNLESPTGAGVSAVYAVILPFLVGHNGKAYFGWATQNSTTDVVNTKTVLEISQVGCKIAYQNTTVRLNGDGSQFALPMFGNECGVIVSGFDDAVAGGYFNGSIYIQKDKIYGFYSGNTLGIRNTTPQAQAWYSNTKDEVVVMYIDNSSGFIKQWKLPTPVSGFVTTAVTAPATATLWQNSATTTGLTANSPYFLKDTYTTIGDMSNTGTIPVGQALSTTVIDLS